MNAEEGRGRSAAEWVTLTLSVLIVGALVAVALIEEANRQDDARTDLHVAFDMERATQREDSYYIPYTVRNFGSEAVSAAEIWFDIYRGEQLTASVEIDVEFLPLQGTQNGVFVTPYDPSTHTITGRLESIQYP